MVDRPLPFSVPEVQGIDDGWGPSSVPAHLDGIPFAPFSKGDKLGRASDWTQQAYQKNYGRYGNSANPVASVFQFVHNEEEDNFHLVDSRPAKPVNRFGNRRFQQNKFQQQRAQRERERDGGKEADKKKPQQQKKNPWQWQGNREQQRQIQYSSSVDVRPEWQVKEQIPYTSLSKLSCSVGEPTDVVKCGELEYYDKSYDRITARAEKPLERTRRVFRSVTTSDDPIIRDLAAKDATARVFVTDTILAALMCTKSSVYSWDVVITRVGDKVFFDKRDGGPLDLLSVNETAPEQIVEDKDSINGVQQLSLEATTINQNLSQQLLLKTGDKYKFDAANPFEAGEGEELASCAYRYRRWRLSDGDNPVDIIVRCELDGVIESKGEVQLLSIKALNEFDLKATDWRKKLESQRGAVLAFETKNNKAKMARWTAAALLAGADMMKLGYVSRAGPRDNMNHIILGTQVTKPKDFAGQINLNMDNCWGIVRAFVDMLLGYDEGKYLLLKDANKDLLRVYAVPEDAFENNYVEEQPVEGEEVPTAVPTAPRVDEAADDV